MRKRYGRSFTARRLCPHRPQAIWEIVTSEDFVLASWVQALEGPMIARPGFSLSVRTSAIPGTAFSGYFDCQFIEVRPGERLTFRLTSISAKPRTFHGALVLDPQGEQTCLSLTLSGFDTRPLNHAPVHDLLEEALENLVQSLSGSRLSASRVVTKDGSKVCGRRRIRTGIG